MNTNLELALQATDTMTPEEAMTYLGTLYQKGMDARCKAMRQGLMGIHDAVAQFTEEIRKQQKTLLEQHPELVFMVLEK